ADRRDCTGDAATGFDNTLPLQRLYEYPVPFLYLSCFPGLVAWSNPRLVRPGLYAYRVLFDQGASGPAQAGGSGLRLLLDPCRRNLVVQICEQALAFSAELPDHTLELVCKTGAALRFAPSELRLEPLVLLGNRLPFFLQGGAEILLRVHQLFYALQVGARLGMGRI